MGRMTAPSFMIASIDSHSSSRLPSMSITWSPCSTPTECSQAATSSERQRISSKETFVSEPSSSTIQRAVLSLPMAISSNQSTAQLKCGPTSGQRKASVAAAASVRCSSRVSRAARRRPVGFIRPSSRAATA